MPSQAKQIIFVIALQKSNLNLMRGIYTMKKSKNFLFLFAVCFFTFAFTLTGCSALRENSPNYKRAANRAARYGRTVSHNGYYRAVGANGTTGALKYRPSNFSRTALRRSGKLFGNVIDSRSANTLRKNSARQNAAVNRSGLKSTYNRRRDALNKYGYTPAKRRTFNSYRNDAVNRNDYSHYYNRSSTRNVQNAVDKNYVNPAARRRDASYVRDYNNTGLYKDVRPYTGVVDKGRLKNANGYVKTTATDNNANKTVVSDGKKVHTESNLKQAAVSVPKKTAVRRNITKTAVKPPAKKLNYKPAAKTHKTVDAAKSTNVKRSVSGSKVRVLTRDEIAARKLNKTKTEKPIENPTVNYWNRMASRIKNPIKPDTNKPIYKNGTRNKAGSSGLNRFPAIRRGANQVGNVPFVRSSSKNRTDSYDRSYGPTGVYIYKH